MYYGNPTQESLRRTSTLSASTEAASSEPRNGNTSTSTSSSTSRARDCASALTRYRGRPDPASSRHACRPALPTGRPKNVRPAPASATGSTHDSKSKNASSVDGYRLCMGLGGYMTRIAAEVAVYEATRKQAESEPTRGDEIEVLTEQRATAHSSHIIDGPPRRCLFQSPSIKSWHWMASSVL